MICVLPRFKMPSASSARSRPRQREYPFKGSRLSPSFTFGISCLALVSGITAWLTFFRKGKLVMTQPTVVFFGPDGSRFDSKKNKIYLRTLLSVRQREDRYLRV